MKKIKNLKNNINSQSCFHFLMLSVNLTMLFCFMLLVLFSSVVQATQHTNDDSATTTIATSITATNNEQNAISFPLSTSTDSLTLSSTKSISEPIHSVIKFDFNVKNDTSSNSVTNLPSTAWSSEIGKSFTKPLVSSIPTIKKKRFFRKKVTTMVDDPKRKFPYRRNTKENNVEQFVRRSDSEIKPTSPIVASSDSEWWTRYLASPQGSSLALTNGAENGALGATLAEQPDYVLHNPATQTLIANLAAQSTNKFDSIAKDTENAELVNLWLSRLYRNALPYIDYALKVASYQKMKEQQDAEMKKGNFANRIRAFYGRNRIFKVKNQEKDFETLNNNEDRLSAQQSSLIFTAKPESTESSISNSSNLNNQNSDENTIFSVSYLQPTYANYRPDHRSSSSASQQQFGYTMRPSMRLSPYRFSANNFRMPKLASTNYRQASSSSSSVFVPAPFSSINQIYPQQSHHLHQQRLASIIPPLPKPWGVEESHIPLIKFNARDGLLPIDIHDPTSMAENARKVIQFDEPESAASGESITKESPLESSSDKSISHRSARRIKMGSFITARSADSSSDKSMKLDMSDIFCKDNFKPIFSEISSRPLSFNSNPLSTINRAQKRSTFADVTAEKFVNSNWTPIQKNNNSIVHRSKRQISNNNNNNDSGILDLPKGTQIKEVDGHTTQLLLNLLKANNPNAGFSGKKISSVYYVYLPKNENRNSQRVLQRQAMTTSSSNTTTTTSTTTSTTTEKPLFWEEPSTRRPNRNRSNSRNRATATTTTTPQPEMKTSFELTESDYEFGEKLCEGRFSGSIADPRHNCQLYFTCNADTIDTYTCPDRYRFDSNSQLCQPAEKVKCSSV